MPVAYAQGSFQDTDPQRGMIGAEEPMEVWRKEVPVPNRMLIIAMGLLASPGLAWGQGNIFQPDAQITSGSAFKEPAFASTEEFLTALETADAGLETLTAKINYRKFFAIQSDEQERRGRLYFRTEPPAEEGMPPKRRFAVTFDELIVADRSEKSEQHYAFDGQWVVEKTPADKQFTKRQVVPPGESFDPLKIGEGPFPVPIGQKRADILDRFDASLVPAAQGLDDSTLIAFAKSNGLVEILLTPKPGTPEADHFETVRIWYEPSGRMLPRIAKTVTPVGDESLVVILAPVVNEPIADELFSTDVPPAEEGWNVHISEYRQPTME